MTEALIVCRDSAFSPEAESRYLKEIKNLYEMHVEKKKDYFRDIADKASNCRNATRFWRIVNSFRQKNNFKSKINLETWFEYLKTSFPRVGQARLNSEFVKSFDPLLNGEIFTEEILISLSKCKNGKAPGLDEINYSFYKNLPQN